MTLRAGSLNRLITISEAVATKDGANQESQAWPPIRQCWASYMAPTGFASIRDADETMPVHAGRCSWRIRYWEPVTNRMRVTYRGQNYDIVDVKHDIARKEYTDLVCQFGVSDG